MQMINIFFHAGLETSMLQQMDSNCIKYYINKVFMGEFPTKFLNSDNGVLFEIRLCFHQSHIQ